MRARPPGIPHKQRTVAQIVKPMGFLLQVKMSWLCAQPRQGVSACDLAGACERYEPTVH